MFKKTATLGLLVFLASSVVLANDPFSDEPVNSKKTASNETLNSSTVNISTENNISSSSNVKTFQYSVVKGDYLYAIAKKLMGDPERWPELVELNKDRYPSLVSNPHMIEVGWVLTIPGGSSTSSTTTASNSSNNTTNNSSNNNNSNSNSTSTSSTLGNTQAKDFYELGDKAYNEYLPYTEDSARGEWIRKVGAIVKNTNT